MPDTTSATATETSAPTTAPITVPIAPPATPAAPLPPAQVPVPATPVVPGEPGEPAWLPARLRRAEEAAQRALLRDLGVEDATAAKTLLKAAKDRADAEKTELERVQAQLAELKGVKDRLGLYEGAVKIHADAQLAALTPEQRAIVEDLSSGEPALTVQLIAKLSPTWKAASPPPAPVAVPVAAAAPAAAVPPTAAPVVRPPLAAPATTAPAASAPAPAATGAENHLATWEALQKSNPMRGADYYLTNYVAIQAARQARG